MSTSDELTTPAEPAKAEETKSLADQALAALETALKEMPADVPPPVVQDQEGSATEPRPYGFELIETRYGRMLVPPDDMYVGRSLQLYGEYCEGEIDLARQLGSPQSRLIVAGANLGALVLPLARYYGEVVAFEPQRWVYQLLCANIVLNGFLNVRAYWAALGNRASVINVPVLDPAVKNNFGGLELELVQNVPGSDIVPVYELDRIPNIECNTLLIDVEGMEIDVLQGATKMIAACRPFIIAEVDRELKKPLVLAKLREWNYDLYWHRVPLFNPDNFKKNPENVFTDPSSGALITSLNVFAVPKERPMKLNGFAPVLDL